MKISLLHSICSLFKKYGELFIRLNGLMETAKMFDGLYSFSFMLDSHLNCLGKIAKTASFLLPSFSLGTRQFPKAMVCVCVCVRVGWWLHFHPLYLSLTLALALYLSLSFFPFVGNSLRLEVRSFSSSFPRRITCADSGQSSPNSWFLRLPIGVCAFLFVIGFPGSTSTPPVL